MKIGDDISAVTARSVARMERAVGSKVTDEQKRKRGSW